MFECVCLKNVSMLDGQNTGVQETANKNPTLFK